MPSRELHRKPLAGSGCEQARGSATAREISLLQEPAAATHTCVESVSFSAVGDARRGTVRIRPTGSESTGRRHGAVSVGATAHASQSSTRSSAGIAAWDCIAACGIMAGTRERVIIGGGAKWREGAGRVSEGTGREYLGTQGAAQLPVLSCSSHVHHWLESTSLSQWLRRLLSRVGVWQLHTQQTKASVVVRWDRNPSKPSKHVRGCLGHTELQDPTSEGDRE